MTAEEFVKAVKTEKDASVELYFEASSECVNV